MTITVGLALALGLVPMSEPAFAKSHKEPKPTKTEREVMTKERLEAAPCTVEGQMAEVESTYGLLATEGNFKCKFKDDTCHFSVEAVDPTTGVQSEFKYDELCVLVPVEFFVPGLCDQMAALDFARSQVPDIALADLTLCKIEQEIEVDESLVEHDVWEMKLSVSADETMGREFQVFKFEIEDTLDGCALFEEDEED
jgi:hypothetical protein